MESKRTGIVLPERQQDDGVDVTTQPTFSAGKPKILFEGRYQPTPSVQPNYSVSPDGQRFLILKPTEEASAPAQINVVLNWLRIVEISAVCHLRPQGPECRVNAR